MLWLGFISSFYVPNLHICFFSPLYFLCFLDAGVNVLRTANLHTSPLQAASADLERSRQR